MASNSLPSTEYLRQCFDYDADTGTLTWHAHRPREHFRTARGWRIWTSRYAGNVAGNPSKFNGYICVVLYDLATRRQYYAHRLIWTMMTGREPNAFIDHRNGDRADNRWANLREATKQQNAWNRPRKRRRDLPKGVYASSKSSTYFAAAQVGGSKVVHIGAFRTPEEAQAAHRAFTAKLHGPFHHPDEEA